MLSRGNLSNDSFDSHMFCAAISQVLKAGFRNENFIPVPKHDSLPQLWLFHFIFQVQQIEDHLTIVEAVKISNAARSGKSRINLEHVWNFIQQAELQVAWSNRAQL